MQNEKFFDYYQREVDFLHKEGAEFSKEFPKIAGRLNFDQFETADPHVARLMEAFAFLTAQVQYKIDNIAFDLTNTLIDVLYPHLNKPLPSLSIAQFCVNDGGNTPTSNGFFIDRDTELFAYTTDKNICRFSTIYPLTLYPIRITGISVIPQDNYHFVQPPATVEFGYQGFRKLSTYFCEVTLSCFDSVFSDLDFHELLFYLDIREDDFQRQVYRSITSSKTLVYCAQEGQTVAYPLLPHSLQTIGFERDEMAIMPTQQENHAYQLLQEYFHFPSKFMFFKLTQLDFLRYLKKEKFLNTHTIKLLIPMSDANGDWGRKIDQTSLRLHCTPIINLFRTTTDPISLEGKKVFYSLSPNAHKDRSMEIYSLDQVLISDDQTGSVKEIPPYFSFSQAFTGASGVSDELQEEKQLFWWSRSLPTHYKNLTGVDTEIAFVDTQFATKETDGAIVYAKALCTNRFMAEDINQGAQLQIEQATPTDEIICLKKPVSPQYSLKKGNNNAKLIAQLSVNYLGFPYGQNTDIANQLKNILFMHTSELTRGQTEAMMQELDSVHLSSTTRRLGQEAWRGVVEGVLIEINIHATGYLNEWYLLSLVLQRYFSMNCQINSFVELVVKLDQVEIFRLAPQFGVQGKI